MSLRVQRIVAVWFVVLIVLPFTAPMHHCDLRDLLRIPYDATTSAMPAMNEANANTFTSPIESSALRASTEIVVAPRPAVSVLLIGSSGLSPSPQVQQAVLRV